MKIQFWIIKILLLLALPCFVACDDDNNGIDMKAEWLRVLPLDIDFAASGGTQKVQLIVTDDVDIDKVQFEVANNGQDWCSISKEGSIMTVTADPTYYAQPRATVVIFTYGTYVREIAINQAASTGADDILLKVKSAIATSEETSSEDRGLDKSYDGDQATWFNSKFGEIKDWPFIIEYTLDESADLLNYIVYYPRSDSGNKWGSFNEYSVYVSSKSDPDNYVKIGDYTRGDANHTPHRIDLETPFENPHKVKFEIKSAFQSRVSCAEMEFYKESLNKFDYSKIFKDDICSELLPDVTESDIKKIPDADYKQLALALFNNIYDTEYRINEYRPYQNPSIMAGINKTEHYSLRDNPTGIYVEPNEEILVIVGDTHGQDISIVVQDLGNGFGASKSYPLVKGSNRVKVTSGGLIYVQNLTNDDIPLILETEDAKAKAAAKTVKLHFVLGKVNGYFDIEKNDLNDWKKMIQIAKYKDIDVLGQRSHITWAVEDFKNADTDIVEIVNKYDKLVYLQQDFMGLEKYDKMFKNRMYFHLDYNGKSPYASRNRTAYIRSYSEIFCNAARFEARLWGPAHEVGHINQTRPGMKWAGTTEVTNNILSMYTQQQFGVESKLIKDKLYERAKQEIIDKGRPHILTGTDLSTQIIFETKLVPFWQLKLYMIEAEGKVDFYKDLFEHYRVTKDLATGSATDGVLQLDFVRQVCRISGLNMLDFFTKWGFLTPVDTTLDDYGTKKFTITQAQIDALIKEINAAGYAQPKADIHLITEENINSYK